MFSTIAACMLLRDDIAEIEKLDEICSATFAIGDCSGLLS